MTQISDLGMQQILLSGFQRAQDAAQTRQIQLSSGKVSNTYSGIGPQTNQLLSAEGVLTRTSAYENAANAALSGCRYRKARFHLSATRSPICASFLSPHWPMAQQNCLPEVQTRRAARPLRAQYAIRRRFRLWRHGWNPAAGCCKYTS